MKKVTLILLALILAFTASQYAAHQRVLCREEYVDSLMKLDDGALFSLICGELAIQGLSNCNNPITSDQATIAINALADKYCE